MAMALDLSAGRSACLGSTAARRSSGPCMVVLPCRRDFRRPAMVCCSAGSREGGSIAPEPHGVDVGAHGKQQEGVRPSRESVTSVASESAVESPDQVHHQAESEAEPLARQSGKPLEEVTGEIEAKAEQAASEETKGGSESALQGLEIAKEAVQKRAKVLAMAAGEAGQKGSQFVDVAKKGIEELKQKLGSSNESSEDERRRSPSSSETLKHSAVDVEDVNRDGEAKLKEQRKQAEEANKHSAVDVEDVNKDGEATLKKQRSQAGQDAAIEQVMEEFVEPARRRGQDDDTHGSSPELGDGNEAPFLATMCHRPDIHLTAPAMARVDASKDASRFLLSADERLGSVAVPNEDEIPVIDMAAKHEDIVRSVAHGCKEWGFLQVINHGIPESLLESVLSVGKEFFYMPLEAKEACNELVKQRGVPCEDPAGIMKYGVRTNPNVKAEFRDGFVINCPRVKEHDIWPANPPAFKEIISSYNEYVKELLKRLLEFASEGLGLEADAIWKAFGTEEHRRIMLMNYYPPFHNPDLVKGLSEHSDPGGITAVLQDFSVAGLEVNNGDRWYVVKPIKNALVINIGDQLQIISNGIYKSAEHRVRVDKEKDRLSIPTFYGPGLKSIVGPIPELVGQNGSQYKTCMTKDYLEYFFSRRRQDSPGWTKGLSVSKTNLDLVKA